MSKEKVKTPDQGGKSEQRGSAITALGLTFSYQGKRVRTAGTPDEPLFRAEDVCKVLELGDTRRACERLDQDDVQIVQEQAKKSHDGVRVGRSYPHLYVTESGLYGLILGCRKPESKAFKRWVTHDVLPEIRRTGTYSLRAELAKHWLLEHCFTELPREVSQRFLPLIVALSELRSERYGGGPVPQWSKLIAQWVYNWAFPDCQTNRRGLNPLVGDSPSRRDYWHLSDEGLSRLDFVVGICVFGAEMSHSWEDWRAKMRRKFEGQTYQPWLPWGTPTKRLPPGGGKAA